MNKFLEKLSWYLSNEKRLTKLTVEFRGITQSENTLVTDSIPVELTDSIIEASISTEQYPEWCFEGKLLENNKFQKLKKQIDIVANKILNKWLEQSYIHTQQSIVSSEPLIGIIWIFHSEFKKLTYNEYKNLLEVRKNEQEERTRCNSRYSFSYFICWWFYNIYVGF